MGALVDPRTGQACGHGVSITVGARTAWLADGLTKVVASSLGEIGLAGDVDAGVTASTEPVAEGQEAGTAVGELLARDQARAVIIDASGRATWLGVVKPEFIAQAHVA